MTTFSFHEMKNNNNEDADDALPDVSVEDTL